MIERKTSDLYQKKILIWIYSVASIDFKKIAYLLSALAPSTVKGNNKQERFPYSKNRVIDDWLITHPKLKLSRKYWE